MKKLLIVLAVLLILVIGGGYAGMRALNLSINDLQANIDVGTGMSAKLACSGWHLSGLGEQQIYADIDSYTPISSVLNLRFSADKRTVQTNILGLGHGSATFRPGLGCTLDVGDTRTLDTLQMQPPQRSAAPWPEGSAVDALTESTQALMEEILATDNAAGYHTRALLMAVDGKIVAEAYAPGFNAQSQLLGWSMGKSLTAMMLGRLEALGRVTSQQTPGFTPWQSDERSDITLEHLLHMSSGLDFSEVYAPGSDATRMLFNAHSASDVAIQSGQAHAPGSHFYYSSGTTNLLSRFITDELGGPQAALDFLRREFYEPLNLADTTFEPDASGVLVGSSYLYASARDWAKLGQLMLDNGRWGNQQILTPEWVARATSPNTSSNDPRYGYQFWLNSGSNELRWPTLPADAYAMSGNRAQSVTVVPSAGVVLVRLGWTNGFYPREENFARLLNTIQVRAD